MSPKGDAGAASGIARPLVEQLMLGAGRVRRFTQDTPILPDVWLAYADALDDGRPIPREAEGDPLPPIKLLFTPYRQTTVGGVRNELHRRLEAGAKPVGGSKSQEKAYPARIVYNQTTVAAALSFENLIRAALPMTYWWHELAKRFAIDRIDKLIEPLALAVEDPEHPNPLGGPRSKSAVRLPPGLLWMMRVVGAIGLVRRGETLPWSDGERIAARRREERTKPDPRWRRIVEAVADLVRGVEPGDPAARVHAINLNREASPTIARSTLAVKADAARKLFDVSCANLAWAVLDVGIDARHPAFRSREKDSRGKEKPLAKPFAAKAGAAANQTRVVATYDFTQLERLLDPETGDLPDGLEERIRADGGEADDLRSLLVDLKDAIRAGQNIDWGRFAPLLAVPHDAKRYRPPGTDHGTHVAGILAADWRKEEANGALEESLIGVCRDLRLFDFRVLDADGRGDEFAIMAALQFVRYLNAAHDYVVIHGVNLSVSITHEVANYACGRTPVCDECERTVAAGIVVVAAAGNQGYRRYATPEGGKAEAYNTSSITDPGNAESVITVGSTHRYKAHTYGVSYFSSRGPTGDGRSKPDLVAPGEKIESTLPDELFGPKDGTSQAAPHVSGAAALLMSRYDELVGQPQRIKEILRATATDLGRERYFQGAGMLDILRALQSV